ncbi:MAG: 30S ribosomal protein S15 [bacterium]|nr:30S ribosomal protein S15 [bacterium]
MALEREKKAHLLQEFRLHDSDTGSADVQIALLTARINDLADHLKTHRKDHHSRRGLLRMVGRRRKLLDYLQRVNEERYKGIIKRLELRK